MHPILQALAIYLVIIAAVLTSIAGWVTNLVWTFQQEALGDIALGILGVVLPGIGMAHGIYLWF
jgi:hypothetical protein